MKKKILMVYDVDGWAWHRNANAIKQYLPQYDISVTNVGGYKHKEYDHVHHLGWVDGSGCARLISGGVTSHNFIRSKTAKKTFKEAWPRFKALTANSKILYDIVKEYNPNTFLAPNGVHEDIFFPVKRAPNKNLVVGWVGQTNGASRLIDEDGSKIDIKGYNLILQPLMKELEGSGIEFRANGSLYTESRPYSEMPDFFNGVDVQICTSYREGTPNPMFEASSCGKALVSTRVGAIADCIKDGENGFLIDEYSKVEDLPQTIAKFKEKLIFLRDNRDVCSDMGERGRSIIEKDWTWAKRAKDWIPLFENVLKR